MMSIFMRQLRSLADSRGLTILVSSQHILNSLLALISYRSLTERVQSPKGMHRRAAPIYPEDQRSARHSPT